MSKRQIFTAIFNLVFIVFLTRYVDWDANAAYAAAIGALAVCELIIVGLMIYERRY
jgi:hypothetical protein